VILKDVARMLKVDAAERSRRIAEWNHPRAWPLAAVPLLLALLAWPALRLWRRREMTTGRGRLAAASAAATPPVAARS